MAEAKAPGLRLGHQNAVLHRLAQRVAQLDLRPPHSRVQLRVADFTSGRGDQAQQSLGRLVKAGGALQEEIAQAPRELAAAIARGGQEFLGEEGVALRAGGDRVRHGRRQGSAGVSRE